MKKAFLTLALACIGSLGFAQDWVLDKNHSHVGFSVIHLLISEVDGNFNTFDAKITSSKEDFSDAKIEFSTDVESINTRVNNRDKHLKSSDYFDAENFPKLTFTSSSVKKVSGNNYKITGDLTMRGTTKQIVLDAVIRGPIDGRGGKKMIGIKASGTVDRVDFGIGSAGGAVSKEVTLNISGEFSK